VGSHSGISWPRVKCMGARFPAAPLGLITVAALLPASWECRLVNRNTEEVTDADFDWADLVMTGGMLPQRPDTQAVIALAQAHGKPVVVGGPDVTSSPEAYATADFRVLGEAEGIIEAFIDAWNADARQGTFTAEKFSIDITKTPARVSICFVANNTPITVFNLPVAVRSPVNSVTLSNFTVAFRGSRRSSRSWPSLRHCIASAIAATSISSMTISSATRKP